LPGNLLSVADSDFETALTGDWTTSNCTITQSATQAFHGAYSLAVTCTAAGNASISSPEFPASALTGYVASGYAYATAAGRTAQAGANWFTSGGTYISSSFLSPQPLTSGAWAPLESALGSPATAGKIQLVFQILSMGTGEVAYLDLLYGAASLWQVLAAWGSGPLGTQAFADMTPWTRADKGIGYTRGRGDEVTAVQPGTATFTLDNSQPGWFAQGNANSVYGAGITLGKQVQLNAVDEAGTWHNRFTGFITDLPTSSVGGPAVESLTVVSAQDIMGWAGRADTMQCMLIEEMLSDQPVALYSLGDAQGSATASDTSGNAAPPLVPKKYGAGTSSVTFGAQGNLIGPVGGVFGITSSPLTSAQFVGSGTSGNTQLEAALPVTVSAAAGFSFEAWFGVLGADAAMCPAGVAHSRSGASLSVLIDSVTGLGKLQFLSSRGATPSYSAALVIANGGTGGGAVNMLVVTVSGTTASLYGAAGIPVTLTIPASFSGAYLTVGGVPGGAGSGNGDYNGAMNCVGVYNTVLTSARVLSHASAGLFDNWGGQFFGAGPGPTITDLVLNTIRYAGIPSSLVTTPPAGVSYPDAYDITGQTPLSMLQLYQQVDGGVLYVSAAGLLTWQDRAARYAAQPAADPSGWGGLPVSGTPATDSYFTVTTAQAAAIAVGNQFTDVTNAGTVFNVTALSPPFAGFVNVSFYPPAASAMNSGDVVTQVQNLVLRAGQYEPPLPLGPTTQFMNNSACFANDAIPGGAHVVNAAAADANGSWVNGDPASPVTGPWYSYATSLTNTPCPDVLSDAANWAVNVYGFPVPRTPSLLVNLGDQASGSGSQVSRASVYAADIGTVIEALSLPASAPGGTRANFLMAEGITESFTRDDHGVTWTLAFNTSPASQSAAWIAGDPALGVLDSTAVVGRGTDGNVNVSGIQRTGPPYPVPAFGNTMNRTGNVGANDMRGLTENIRQAVYPPCMLAQQQTTAQSVPNATAEDVRWDFIFYDTANGFAAAGLPAVTWVASVAGVYLLAANVTFPSNAAGTREAWFQQNGATVGTPENLGPAGSAATGLFICEEITCAVGDQLKVTCEQTSGGALVLPAGGNGCTFSILMLGT
jgi:hypothetical protein